PNLTITVQASKDYDNSHVAGWPPAPIELPTLGSNFAVTQPGGMGGRIYVCDAGNFNGDPKGYPDLVGLELTGPTSDVQATSQLLCIYNYYTPPPVRMSRTSGSTAPVSSRTSTHIPARRRSPWATTAAMGSSTSFS
ncbi:hypothetical protein D4R89_01540, partial [bacterium]